MQRLDLGDALNDIFEVHYSPSKFKHASQTRTQDVTESLLNRVRMHLNRASAKWQKQPENNSLFANVIEHDQNDSTDDNESFESHIYGPTTNECNETLAAKDSIPNKATSAIIDEWKTNIDDIDSYQDGCNGSLFADANYWPHSQTPAKDNASNKNELKTNIDDIDAYQQRYNGSLMADANCGPQKPVKNSSFTSVVMDNESMTDKGSMFDIQSHKNELKTNIDRYRRMNDQSLKRKVHNSRDWRDDQLDGPTTPLSNADSDTSCNKQQNTNCCTYFDDYV